MSDRLRRPSPGTVRRAQLILVGSVALAVVILSLAVVMNSLLVTQTNAIGGTADQVGDVRTFDYETRNGVQSLVFYLNHGDRNTTSAELAANVSENVSAYSQLLAESSAQSGSTVVDVSYHNDSSEFGWRVVQAGDGPLRDPTNPTPNPPATRWSPVPAPASPDRTVGWFTMNVNVDETKRQPFSVTATNATGEWVNVTVNRTATDDLAVESTASFTGTTSTTCTPSQGRALLDFVAGDTLAGGCNFTGFDALEPPVAVQFVHGDRAVARYEIAVNESISSSLYDRCDTTVPPSEACLSPVVWTVNATTTVESDRVSHENSYNVSVYDP